MVSMGLLSALAASGSTLESSVTSQHSLSQGRGLSTGNNKGKQRKKKTMFRKQYLYHTHIAYTTENKFCIFFLRYASFLNPSVHNKRRNGPRLLVIPKIVSLIHISF